MSDPSKASNNTVTCKSCIYQISFGMETERDILGETPIEELPPELHYLHICPTATCSAILGPEDDRCHDCTVALNDGLPI